MDANGFLGPWLTRRRGPSALAHDRNRRHPTGHAWVYDVPRLNTLTGKPTNPDPRRVIDALARHDQARMLVDGLIAANDLGLADAVPAKIAVHTDARLRPIKLGEQTITFKLAAPSRLYWAASPGMRAVQALPGCATC